MWPLSRNSCAKAFGSWSWDKHFRLKKEGEGFTD